MGFVPRDRKPSKDRNLPSVDVSSGSVKQVATFKSIRWGFSTIAIDPSGDFIAAGGISADLTGFSVKHESLLSKLPLRDLLSSITAIEYSPDGSLLLVAGRKGLVQVFSVNKRGKLKPLSRFVGHSKEVGCIAISPDGKFALTGSSEDKARYWEVESGKEMHTLSGFKGKVKAVSISTNGKRIRATDGALFIDYDLNEQEIIHQRPLTRSWASGQASAISPDGRYIAAGESYDIHVWDLETGREFPKMEGSEIQWSMKFTPNGSHLLSGGLGKINVWDPETGKRVLVQEVDDSYVKDIAVSHDGTTFTHAASTGRTMSVFQFEE